MLRIRCLILHERQPAMRAWLRDSLSGSVSTFALCLGQLGPNETADIPGHSGSPTPTCFGTAHLTLRNQTHCKCFASGSLAFQEWLRVMSTCRASPILRSDPSWHTLMELNSLSEQRQLLTAVGQTQRAAKNGATSKAPTKQTSEYLCLFLTCKPLFDQAS